MAAAHACVLCFPPLSLFLLAVLTISFGASSSGHVSGRRGDSLRMRTVRATTAVERQQQQLLVSEDDRQQVVESNISTAEESGGSGSGDGDSAEGFSSVSIAAQSVLTFVTVLFLGCAVVMAVYAWKRFSEDSVR